MAIISTFELLIKPQLPKNIPGTTTPIPGQVSKLSRNIILGYFLTLSNLSNSDFDFELVFTIKLPVGRVIDELVGIIDTSGSDIPFDLAPIGPNQFGATMQIPAQSTSLVILQPDLIQFPALLTSLNFEVRGFVEMRRAAASQALPPISIIATPEHRGTFFSSLSGSTPDEIGLDQVAYALPIKNGGCLDI